MKKILTIVAVAVIIAVVANGITGCGTKGSIDYVQHNPEAQKIDVPEGIDIYVDASGSMKGYVDGVTGNFKTNVPDLTTNPTNNNAFGMRTDSVRCYTINNKKVVPHETVAFCNSIRDKSLFNGASTELHDMFEVVAKNQIANPNHVSVIVSDCILSFPHADIVSNPETNVLNIGILESNVTRSMTSLVNNNMSVVIVKYMSDFNGSYYYSYHDEPLASASGKTLKDRPYYFVLVGKREKIDAMFNKNVLPAGYVGQYMFNKDCAKPKFTVIRPQKSGAVVGLKNNIPAINVNYKGKDNAAPYFYVAVEDFSVPSYLEPLDDIMNAPLCKGDIIAKVESVKYDVVSGDKNFNDNLIVSYFYKVTLKTNDQLRNISSVSDEIQFKAKTLDAADSEIINADVKELAELEKKTFMFSHLIRAIEKAYLGSESMVAKVMLEISKK